MNKGLSSFAEIKDRCERKPPARVYQVVSTKDDDVFVIVFTDGTQAAVNLATLEKVHQELITNLL